MQVLDIKLPFDELMVITDMLPYIKRSLRLDSMSVHLVTDADAVAASPTPLSIAAASPGTPVASWKLEVATTEAAVAAQ